MGLKKESERDTAHRIFKFYKATGKFPPEMSPLESVRLLSKYNYFIAADIDKKVVNTLTEICNVLDAERMVVVFGDFMLDTLTYGLQSYKYDSNNRVKISYIDCIEQNPVEILANSANTKSHFNTYIIYVVDNIEVLKKKDVDKLCKLKQELQGGRKSIVCCCLNIDEINPAFRSCFRKFRLGNYENEDVSIKNLIYALFNNEDRKEALELLENADFSALSLINTAAHNLPHFYEDPAGFESNLKVLEKAIRFMYKASNELFWNYIVKSWTITKVKRVIRFPVKIEQKPVINVVSRDNARKTISPVRKQTNVNQNKKPNITTHKEIKQKPKKKLGGLLKYAK